MKNLVLCKLIKEFLREKSYKKLKDLIDTVHIVDIAHSLEKMDFEERIQLYKLVDAQNLAEIMTEVSAELHEEIIAEMDTNKLKVMLDEMSNDDIADIFGELSEDEVRGLMKLLDVEEREEVKKLISHDSDTAGGLMTTDYFAVDSGTKINDAISQIKKYGEDAELVYYIYVLEKDSESLLGVASLRELIISNQQITIDKVMEKNIISVKPQTDQEDVANMISKYDLLAVPVVDEDNKMQGIITVDDIIDVIEEEATEDIYVMAGLTEEEMEDDVSMFVAVKLRMPWLLVSLIGELISATILLKFEATLEKIVALAFFIPLIMAMGGNSGSQSSAVMVRKIALGEVEKYKLKKVVLKESLSGITLGLISGVMVALLVTLVSFKYFPTEPLMGTAIGVALFIAISFAATAGTVIPLMFHKYKIDPAVASGPLITTFNDIGGLVIYFVVATLLLI